MPNPVRNKSPLQQVVLFIQFVLLYPFSLLYGGITWLRNYAYDRNWIKSRSFPMPIVSVGNVSVGGTGKTPMAEYILGHFLAQGKKAAYLSRGYGRSTQGYQEVSQEGSAKLYGDEAFQVCSKFPEVAVRVCEDRSTGIDHLHKECNPDVVVLDDAFQHRKVKRNLDILMVDANRLPTQDYPLPLGRLREGRTGISRADLIIVNKLNDPARIPGIVRELRHFSKPVAFCNPVFKQVVSFWEPTGSQTDIQEKKVIVFSGIGNNTYFAQQVGTWASEVIETVFFRDHYRYTEKDLQGIAQKFDRGSHKYPGLQIICTEKDYYRLKNEPWLSKYSYLPLTYVQIGLTWWKGEELVAKYVRACMEK